MKTSPTDLIRLERVLVGIMRTGVALSAAILAIGLVLTALSVFGAGMALAVGLVVLMCIPAARILASFGDALVRKDVVLAVATAYVRALLFWQFLKTL